MAGPGDGVGKRSGARRHRLGEILGTLVSWPILRLALVYFGLTTGLYGIELWLPQIVKGFGLSNIQVGFVSAIPYLLAICTMGFWARHSDRSGDRFGHVACPAPSASSAWPPPDTSTTTPSPS